MVNHFELAVEQFSLPAYWDQVSSELNSGIVIFVRVETVVLQPTLYKYNNKVKII